MLAKNWKRIGLVILILACLVNIVVKLTKKVSFEKELQGVVDKDYVQVVDERKR